MDDIVMGEAERPSFLQRAKAPGTTPEQAAALLRAHELQRHFDGDKLRRFVFEDIVGAGSYGVVCKILQKPSGDGQNWMPEKRFIVKQSLDNGPRADSIRNEIQMLQRLKGAPHIISLEALYRSPILGIAGGPTMITEFIENGTLLSFIRRALARGERLPNRLLWRLFLCMVRWLLAMAWPDFDPKEQVYSVPKAQIIHRDMSFRNIMIGGFEQNEHSLVPMLKLIDFGSAQNHPAEEFNVGTDPGVRINIFAIGETMHNLITGIGEPLHWYGQQQLRIGGQVAEVSSHSTLALPNYEYLDDDLRGTVTWCLAHDPMHRPELENLYNIIIQQNVIKTAAAYAGTPWWEIETDEAIWDFVKSVMIPQIDPGLYW